MSFINRIFFLAIVFSLCPAVFCNAQSGYAQVTLPKVFGDNMVLQRGINIPVWGNATPGSLIVATLGKVSTKAKTDKDGKWMLHFSKFNAGGPYDLKISESGKPYSAIKLTGILIGDVWLASGQSNMEFQVQQARDAPNEIGKADFPQIRFLIVEHDIKLTPQSDFLAGKWKLCDTNNVKQFSAVAYYFARKIHREQNVPIGIIQSTWGGTPVQTWTSREMLLTSTATRAKILANDTLSQNDFAKDSLNMVRFWDIVYHPQGSSDKIVPLPEYDDSGWTAVEMPRTVKDFGIGKYEGMMWLRKKVVLPPSFTGKQLVLNIGLPEMSYSLYFNGAEICKTIWSSNPKQFYTIPASLVKNGQNTICIRMAMLWGGGGLNPPAENIYITDNVAKVSLAGKWLYKKDVEPALPQIRNYQNYSALLFNGMIHPLIPFGIKGVIWYQGEANDTEAYRYRELFPMLINDWRQRWHQGNLPFLYVQLANFKKVNPLPSESEWAELREAQTLTLSQPNTGMTCIIDIGDANSIHPLNKQEVGRRLALIADKKVYEKNVIASGPMYKNCAIKGKDIIISFTDTGSGLVTSDIDSLKGFAIAGDDRKFYWASARIEGNKVIVSSDKVAVPVAVRYAWADNPVCNLVNKEGLPAVPFRTDEWKGITQK
ncbi:sialate O-acetylesterase [Mucilaginibacter mallensis]|uniref:Sialate O-acetylesterase n=1 Tax=Mucilaginibacter mallensis TaxID=652787 RepID=A0A1H1Q7P5_MUCMA|nr:sialate O-acetylesterase [Mucilaginibacter mallensis]SDS19538.1 sialate O-acetylesterase [Mucilaginibacter mallensis]